MEIFIPAVWSMETGWIQTTAQWPVEREPLVADIDNDGTNEIILVNRGGQVLLWDLKGNPLGAGQDGQVAQLPEGRWTVRPVYLGDKTAGRLLFCSVEGKVVALDNRFKLVFSYQLPGETTWGYALPALYEAESGPLICYGDNSGIITCLSAQGMVLWQANPAEGMCTVPLQTIDTDNGSLILAPIGRTLCALDTNGRSLWQRDLGDPISTQPQFTKHEEIMTIVCGSKNGKLWGLDLSGKILWQTGIDDEVNAFFSFYPRNDAAPMILCTGLWGNLHAFDSAGNHLWTHYYRAKGRGVPLIFDADGDGDYEILVATYAQHMYIFNEHGAIVDDVRLTGAINSSPVPFFDPEQNRHDVLLTTASLLTFCLRPAFLKPIYGDDTHSDNIRIEMANRFSTSEPPVVMIHNPDGMALAVNITVMVGENTKIISGCCFSRSQIEIPVPVETPEEIQSIRVELRNREHQLIEANNWQKLPAPFNLPSKITTGLFHAWSTASCADFDSDRLLPVKGEFPHDGERKIVVDPVYRNETEAGALVVASADFKTNLLRILTENPQDLSGEQFKGKITLHQVIPVGSVNGEYVADALPALNSGGIVTLPPQQSIKIYLKIDAEETPPGIFEGRVRIIPLPNPADTISFSLEIHVVDVTLPAEFPLTLCTWDYVPNQWFPDNTEAVLDDMNRHGVNVFPRHQIPAAVYDLTGKLVVDWQILDKELVRLIDRGTILFQISRPPIEFKGNFSEQEKHEAEIRYVRDFRDHLKEKGRDYNDFGFYPLDEPGLHYGKNIPYFIKAARLFREADPEIRIYTDPVPGLSFMDFERIEPYLDIWCPNMRLVNGLLANDPRMLRIMKSGDPVWSYECVSNVKTLSPLRYNRANAWRAKYFGLDGIGFWTHSQTNKDHWFAGSSINDEYALVYPGIKPVSSLRWEAVRDGLEDIAAIKLLEQYIAENRRLGKNGRLTTVAEKYLSLALTDIMELSDAAFVEARDYLKEGDRRIWHTFTDLELFQTHRREIARLTLLLKQE